jgi:adenine/guanine phosphoribosyltransferase-like PRPP-binding protein
LEGLIDDAVVKERLYKLGSYRLSDQSVALGWINVNRLLSKSTLANRIVTECHAWLNRQRIFEAGAREVLIVGVDFVGAMAASQLSVRSGALNYCIASRAGGDYHTDLENFSQEEVHRFLDPVKKIVLIADVVSTGSSLAALHNQIMDDVKLFADKQIEWYALSVFGREKSIVPDAVKFLKAFGVCCKSVPLPVHDAEDFPSSRFVEPMLDLRRDGVGDK